MESSLPDPTDRPIRPKLLILEFWGLGDLTFSTPLLIAAKDRFDCTLAGKPHATPLLQKSFPRVEFVSYDAPWSAYRGKYAFWKWNWPALIRLVFRLRREEFDAAVSVRNDPRDHLLMWIVGARQRLGFARRGSGIFLTDPLHRTREKQHKVEDWRDIGRALGLAEIDGIDPHLDHREYRTGIGDRTFEGVDAPVICFHPGARITVRRWPESYFRKVIAGLRRAFHFHLILIPDPDGYGSGLVDLADTVLRPLSVVELVDVLGRIDLLICNDSGPGHLAASCGKPTIPVFGPTDPDWFRPWGAGHHIVIRDICPHRPCFDYCHFSEAYCLTRLMPDDASPEIHAHIETLIDRGTLPGELRKSAAKATAPSAEKEPSLSLAYSIADQNVATTKSIGIYNFSLQLLQLLAESRGIDTMTVLTNPTVQLPPLGRENVRMQNFDSPVGTRVGRILWDQWGVLRAAHATGHRWLFLPKGFSPFVAQPQLRIAAYVHDLMGDFYRRHYPSFWPKAEFGYFARSLIATIQRAEVIFTNTEYTRSRIIEIARRESLPRPRVVVAGYGFHRPDPQPVEKRNRILLFASNLPHKRTDIAIRFLDHWLRASSFDGVIECIGIIPDEMKKTGDPRWDWIGRVPPAKAREMIRRSRVVVYVSEHEGFGMPPVEAVLDGTCPVYSDLAPIREVMGDAGFAFSNESADSFAGAMTGALEATGDSIDRWREALLARHSWEKVTRKILAELLRS